MSRAGRVVAAIDQGTTSTRCLLFDHGGRMVSVAQLEHRQHFPEPGWVEHDAAQIWRNTARVVPQALRGAGLDVSDLAAIGIANQRETTIVWERATGRPVRPAITWQDTRTADLAAEIARSPSGHRFGEVTGLTPTGYFAAPRLRWLLDHVPGLQARAVRGEVLFGTMETWLVWNLTGGPDGGVHVTDVTNASRTMLMDLRTLQWDDELLGLLDVPRAMLPEIRPNAQVWGACTTVAPGVPIGGAFGDQQAALFGQVCFEEGEAKCTYGTGAFLLSNTGSRISSSTHGLLPTVAFALEGEPPVYATEGSIAMTGSLVQWFRDGLEMITSAPEIETLARRVEDNGGCYVVPAFSGLYAPRWQPDARGVIVGLTSYVTKAHLARAVLEATAWQTREVVDAMDADTVDTGDAGDAGTGITRLRVDGGMTANNLLMQLVADVLDVPVERPLAFESVSLGAAYGAGLAVGYWSDLQGLRRNWHRAALWESRMSEETRRTERAAWGRAVERTYDWVQHPR